MPSPQSQTTVSVAEERAASPSELKTQIPTARRYVVAVHGIGDQYYNATVQSVVSAFAGFFNYPAGVPLGAFRKPPPAIATFALETPDTLGALPVPKELIETSFVEIYWADIPRKVQQEGYTIEETKAWARTVVARLRARYEGFTNPAGKMRQASAPSVAGVLPPLSPNEYRSVADALEEMIETFNVLGNLLWIAEKAGVLKFDLDNLLTSYVGDVQIVADFEDFRAGILQRFTKVMEAIALPSPGGSDVAPEIYVVAHSEGTVVAFMGLLQGMAQGQPAAQWYQYVRGFMTFGSPIDKHIVLWPDIWKPVTDPRPDVLEFCRSNQSRKIWWKNYYDKGDPVGFKLDTTRDWLKSHQWAEAFRFDENNDDHGFARYPMPGDAHNRYWKDPDVFGHFIENVVGVKNGAPRYSQPPRTRLIAALIAYVVPYFLIYSLCCLGCYFIYKATEAFVLRPLLLRESVINVLGIGALLTGMIFCARVMKLTRRLRWIAMAVVGFIICAVPYYFVPEEFQQKQALFQFGHWKLAHAPGLFVIASAFLTAFIVGMIGRIDPRRWKQGIAIGLRTICRGARPLLIVVSLQVAAMVIHRLVFNWPSLASDGKHPIWPVFLAFGAFVYLWWLAILLFDLVFVWHRYIRWAGGPEVLRGMRDARKDAELNSLR
jgi:hypothetical protein